MKVYEYGVVRMIGDDKLVKAIEDYTNQGHEIVTVTWVGNRSVKQMAGSIVHPATPPDAMVPMFIMVVRRSNEVPGGIES